MSFGISALGKSSSIALSSEVPAFVFVGKATRITGTGLTFFPFDTGSSSFTCFSGGCGGLSITLRSPDDTGVYTYSIASAGEPIVFISTTNFDVTATIIGLAPTGTTNGAGLPIWYLRVLISYPLGLRDGALPFIDVYCFDRIPNTPQSGNGIAVYDGGGVLTFSSSFNPLRVKDIVQFTSTTTPANLADIVINKTTLADPVQSVFDVPKPAFLNIDWGRYIVTTRVFYNTCVAQVCDPFCRCIQCGTVAASFQQTFVTGGVRLNTTRTDLVISLVSQSLDSFTCSGAPAGYVKRERLPISIPVINGADYD
jgi:hypothetical protein